MIFMLIVICVITSSFIIIFSYGLYQNYRMVEADEESKVNLNYSSWSKKNLSNHIITYFKKFFRFHLKSEARV